MKIRDVLGLLFFVILAPFIIGVAVLSWQIGQTWTASNTDTLLGALIAFCVGGGVIALFLGLIVVLVLLAVARERNRNQPGPAPAQYPPHMLPPGYGPATPQIVDQAPAPMPMLMEEADPKLGSVTPAGVVRDEWND